MNNSKQKSVPKWILVVIGIIVLCVIFFIAVQLPFNKERPKYEADHASATSQIDVYKDYLARFDEVEQKITEMKEEFNQKKDTLYVQPGQIADDIEDLLAEISVSISDFSVSEGAPDGSGAISATGDPLYRSDISVNFNSTREKMIETFKYFESESKGAYYISAISVAKNKKTTAEGSEVSMKSSEETYSIKMTVTLFYFNSEENQGLPVAAASSTESSAA